MPWPCGQTWMKWTNGQADGRCSLILKGGSGGLAFSQQIFMKFLLKIYCIERCIWVKFFHRIFIFVFLVNIFQWNLEIFAHFQSNRSQKLFTRFLWDLFYINFQSLFYKSVFLPFSFRIIFFFCKYLKKNFVFLGNNVKNLYFLFFKKTFFEQTDWKINAKKNDTTINYLPWKLTEFYNFKVTKSKFIGNRD